MYEARKRLSVFSELYRELAHKLLLLLFVVCLLFVCCLFVVCLLFVCYLFVICLLFVCYLFVICYLFVVVVVFIGKEARLDCCS